MPTASQLSDSELEDPIGSWPDAEGAAICAGRQVGGGYKPRCSTIDPLGRPVEPDV